MAKQKIFNGDQPCSVLSDGRIFEDCETTRDAIASLEWANTVLSQPAVTYPNGRNSHEAAGEVLDKAEDILLDYQRFDFTAA